jgi:uncharacterized cupin superfamily protein
MKIPNISQIIPIERQSPKGKYALKRFDLSAALGVPNDAPPELGGHPFAVERAVLPPGKQNFPLHSHAAQWEFYLIESGNGIVMTETERHPIQAGDFFMCSPGEAHAIVNTSNSADLVFLVIANNSLADLTYYPNSKKYNAKPGRLTFNHTVDYYLDEE